MTSKTNKLTRRQFLSKTALAATIAIVPRHVLGGPDYTPPSERLNIAGVGIGGMGASDLKNVKEENIVALCDVDEAYAGKIYEEYPKAKRYRDFRKMFEKQKDIDAVIVATPDHTHAVVTMAAIQEGKHVYCQKPLTHNIYEARKITEAAREAKIVTQMGIQGHSGEGCRLICEWIWDGAIGQVKEVDAWSSLTYYPWGHSWWSTTHSSQPEEIVPVPSSLDWDLWLGPAQYRPYHPCYHPAKWRAWWDFGCGMLGDRGCHTLDPVFWALRLGQPVSVEASRTDYNEHTHPVASLVTYRFPARGNLPPLKLTWYDGLQPPRPEELEDGRRIGDEEGGVLFKGDKGILTCGVYGDSPQLIPYSKMREYERPEQSLPRVDGTHEMDWVRAIKKGRQAGANFEYSGPLTEVVLLGNIAKRVNDKLYWDAEDLKIINNDAAQAFVSREYRDGWFL